MEEWILTVVQRDSGQQRQFIFASKELAEAGLTHAQSGNEFKHKAGVTELTPSDYIEWSVCSAHAIFAQVEWFTEHNIRAQTRGQTNAQNSTIARAVPLIKGAN